MGVVCERSRLDAFKGLLQSGVTVPVRTGASVLSFLTDQLGIEPREVEARITTVFLDGKVVDALDAAALQDGSRLALSAALPGLVGATMRRSGTYSAMRSEITWAAPGVDQGELGAAGTIQLKLFNLLIDALGPAVLRHGVVLDAAEVTRLVGRRRGMGRRPAAERVLLQTSFE
jgi:hypothetical protein